VVCDQAHDMQSRHLVALAATQNLPIRANPAERTVEQAFEPGPQLTINVVGVQSQEQRANSIVGGEVWRAAAKWTPEQAPVLVCPDPAAAQRVATVEHAHEHQAEERRKRIAATLSPAWVGQGGQAAQ